MGTASSQPSTTLCNSRHPLQYPLPSHNGLVPRSGTFSTSTESQSRVQRFGRSQTAPRTHPSGTHLHLVTLRESAAGLLCPSVQGEQIPRARYQCYQSTIQTSHSSPPASSYLPDSHSPPYCKPSNATSPTSAHEPAYRLSSLHSGERKWPRPRHKMIDSKDRPARRQNSLHTLQPRLAAAEPAKEQYPVRKHTWAN